MSGAAFPCGCGKGLRSLEALRAHQAAIGCENAKKRKKRKSSTRMKAKRRANPQWKRPVDENGFDCEGIQHV